MGMTGQAVNPLSDSQSMVGNRQAPAPWFVFDAKYRCLSPLSGRAKRSHVQPPIHEFDDDGFEQAAVQAGRFINKVMTLGDDAEKGEAVSTSLEYRDKERGAVRDGAFSKSRRRTCLSPRPHRSRI